MNILPEQLTLPPRTVTKAGAALDLAAECLVFGPRGMIVHGRSLRESGLLDRILAGFPDRARVVTHEHPGGEPALGDVDAALARASASAVSWIAAIGGGSVMDAGKACAGLLGTGASLSACHAGAPLPPSRTPFIAVPTTAGTGSEATIVSVLTNAADGVKKSIRHPSHMARTVILDPRLLASCPASVLAASGMDAFTQAVESFISRGATTFTDALALEAVRLIHAALVPAYEGDRSEARCMGLLTGSYLAGVALSHARLGIVHGLAHPLGARYHQPHGLVCAVCLPHALAFNRGVSGEKYRILGDEVGGDVIRVTEEMLVRLGLHSPFAALPLKDEDAIVRETLASGSTAANPRPVGDAEARELLRAIFASTSAR